MLWPFTNDQSLLRVRSQLAALDLQLQGLKDLLQDYKSKHGRYPSNDEGLAVLDNFASRFTVAFVGPQDDEAGGFSSEGAPRLWEPNGRRSIEAYRDRFGAVPQNAQQFWMFSRVGDWRLADATDEPHGEVDIGIDRHCNLFVLDRAGVLSPWLLPYLYENRAGHAVADFRGSIAGGDRWGYSIKVDDGVFVASSGGYLLARELSAMWWMHHGPQLFGGLLILCGAALAVARAARARRGGALWALAAVIPGFFAGGILTTLNAATCYAMGALFARRTPAMVSLQRELLEKYRQQGVIDEDTYRQAVAAARRDTLSMDEPSEPEDP